MITSKFFLNKTFLILGMGITGISLAKSLKKSGGKVLYWDDNEIIKKKLFNKGYILYKDSLLKKEKIVFIIPSPGIPISGKNQHNIIARSKRLKIRKSSLDDLHGYLETLDIDYQILYKYYNNDNNDNNNKLITDKSHHNIHSV